MNIIELVIEKLTLLEIVQGNVTERCANVIAVLTKVRGEGT